MLIRSVTRQQLPRLIGGLKQIRYLSQLAPEAKEDDGGKAAVRLSPHRPKKPTREPFAKNIFLGKFDLDFLTYTEPQTQHRFRDFFEWIKPIEDYVRDCIDPREIDEKGQVKKEIFDNLGELGALRASIDETYGGLSLNSSEYAKLVETISRVPVLGSYMIARDRIIRLIRTYGSEDLKQNFLTKIADGRINPSLAFSESPTGSVSDPLTAAAKISQCLSYYVLSGRKSCVFDADRADTFLVMAENTASDTFVRSSCLNGFFVDAKAQGVSIEKPEYPLLGQRGIGLFTVNFDNVKVPAEHLLSITNAEHNIFVDILGVSKHNVGAQAIGLMKDFLNLLIGAISRTKYFNEKRRQEDSMQEVIGKVSATLYCMEAMTYATSGMEDDYENQDCLLEKSLVECYCVDNCAKTILHGMGALGAMAYDKREPFERILRDALALGMCDRTSIDMKIFAALLGMQHAGLALSKKMKWIRNPMAYPWEILRTKFTWGGPNKLRIGDNLHPSLGSAAESLEYSVHSLKVCVETLFARRGAEFITQRIDIKRLADTITQIYAITTVVGRASRAYCIGLRNAEEEIKVALYFTYHTNEKVKVLTRELLEGDWVNGDLSIKDSANKSFDAKEYFAAHPLNRNF